jgi:hypothetical protein
MSGPSDEDVTNPSNPVMPATGAVPRSSATAAAPTAPASAAAPVAPATAASPTTPAGAAAPSAPATAAAPTTLASATAPAAPAATNPSLVDRYKTFFIVAAFDPDRDRGGVWTRPHRKKRPTRTKTDWCCTGMSICAKSISLSTTANGSRRCWCRKGPRLRAERYWPGWIRVGS